MIGWKGTALEIFMVLDMRSLEWWANGLGNTQTVTFKTQGRAIKAREVWVPATAERILDTPNQ